MSARKAGLNLAKGEYVTYVDGDDWTDLNAYSSMYSKIIAENADIVFYNHYQNTGESQKLICHNIETGTYDKEALINRVYPHMISGSEFYEWQIFPSVWDFIIKKDLLEKSQYEIDDDISMGEDAACTYPCLLMANRVCFVNEAYYHYRQTQHSMVKNKQDLETERRKFQALYNNGKRRLGALADVYDVRKQWIYYILFLMIPRADHLYHGYQNLPFLFPYVDVKRGMKIAIYGAGTYGQRLYKYLLETKYCDVVAWYDRNYIELSKMGLDVMNPDTIDNLECDGIIIANMFSNSRKAISDFIKSKTDIKIYEIDERVISSDEYLIGFGLV